MKSLLLFALIAISYTIDPASIATSYKPSRVTTSCEGGESNCKECWAGKPNFCYSCKDTYTFDNVGGCTNSQATIVAGYRRDCAICGVHNFANEKNGYKCAPCAFGCSRCNQENSGKCAECRPEYVLESDGTCSCKIGEEIDGSCFCNKESSYIVIDPVDGKQCMACDQCHRDIPNCSSFECPKYTFDLDRKDCCTPCHESCEECIGETNKDCTVKSNVRMCRNNDLWEEVAGQEECFCVCYADEVKDDEGKSYCKCHEHRVATDTCISKSCDASEQQHKWQCFCDPAQGFYEGPKDVNGHTTCEHK